MDRERHERASELWSAIERMQDEIHIFERASFADDSLFVGCIDMYSDNAVGVSICGETKDNVVKIISESLNNQLRIYKKEYEKL